jgi:cell filamentation protein
MYDAVPDPYCYPGTTVLINKLDLRGADRLAAFEAEITSQRAAEPLPDGALDAAHYQAIHRHLFQDVYAWAGELRTVRISKEGSMFCYPENIAAELRKLFGELATARCFRELPRDDFVRIAAHFLSELNAIHAFREGNGRTQLVFLTLLADQAGHPLHLDRIDPERMLAAMVHSFVASDTELRDVIAGLVNH